ncbi:hypothetical protein I316_05464 [Kwoniella heveanensis BCC8398]|uniref:BZIP domain-containing protein n=1 Tax=Kwoniella heveanensis BCC8398 TaxID=1296120 RepID=A0A1B9GPB7_9TREE|nr:hypothetical protein I316_05464 [Kwoniella heveanensis BCC8398]
MTFNFDFNMEPVEWDQFLVDADLGLGDAHAPFAASASSPASPNSASSTPKSTESEQSAALDPENDFDFNFGFDLPNLDVGITHRPEDIFQPIPSDGFAVPDNRGAQDPTMTHTFGLSFGDFGLHTDLGADAASQLGLTNLLDKLTEEKTIRQQPSSASASNDLTDAYALLDKLLPAATSPVSVQPSQLSLPPSPPALKRKASESSDESAPAAKRRGRPPGSGKPKTVSVQDPKAASRRPPKSSPLITSGSPAFSIGSAAADVEDSDAESVDSPTVVKRTASGKPSTARPKSVVPEKFLKDGSAQAILGMDIPTIQSFPTFEELLKKVDPRFVDGAREFGERIAENRDKAKDAAKKSRDERRAKIERAEELEKKVEDLQNTVKGMTSVLIALVDRGILSKEQVALYL